MIKYLGSKRLLLPLITATVAALDTPDAPVNSVTDLFSGTARVGHALKRAGYRVRSNDHNAYAATLARCYVAADHEKHAETATRLLEELSHVTPRADWFTETYCVGARYFTPENGARIEAMRGQIAAWSLQPELEAVLLVALMEAADRVDSTVGVQMAYLKQWAARALKPLKLRLPDLLPCAKNGAGDAHALDALDAAAALDADLVYLDPPYNQHSYLGNYHVWETLVRWDAPDVYGVAQKRIDVRERKSAFNSKRQIAEALTQVVAACRAPRLLVSFSNEGAIRHSEMVALLSSRGSVSTLSRGHGRYIGSQIGVYDPQGRKVGTPGKSRNIEYLFVVTAAPWHGGEALVAAGIADGFHVATNDAS
jgi:adenine-specific DNA-methyltransferase